MSMLEYLVNGKIYKIPSGLNEFQTGLYVHLIDWKWKNLTKEPGKYRFERKEKNSTTKKSYEIEYDAMLPDAMQDQWKVLYPPIVEELKELKKKFPFKPHTHIDHMASSQAANLNLFIPILLSPQADSILREIKPDFKTLAREYLYKGFQVEYWDAIGETGLLGDHSKRSGTDADIAIAYYNKNNELCLWLIEHKLTEAEFTTCGGYKSKNRDKELHNCDSSFTAILGNKRLCYYTDIRGFNYWDWTDKFQTLFPGHHNSEGCPFKGGMNQLWRNQLMGLAIETCAEMPFKQVYFSVVRHPENSYLDRTLADYENLMDWNSKFSVYTSKDFIDSAGRYADADLDDWIDWYKELYKIS